MTPSLETRNLTVRFGGHVAVDHVSCAFRPGELTAIETELAALVNRDAMIGVAKATAPEDLGKAAAPR